MGGGGEHASYPKSALAATVFQATTIADMTSRLLVRRRFNRSVVNVGVWSPAGGWWADPVHWRRNTALAFLCVPPVPHGPSIWPVMLGFVSVTRVH